MNTLIWFTCPCDCLHPSRCRLLSPVYISMCFLSLCASSSCLPSQPAVFLAPIFPSLCLFLVLLVSTLACPDSEPTCLTTLPVLTTSLPIPLICFGLGFWPQPGLTSRLPIVWFWPGLWTLACHRPAFSLCYNIINIGALPSASCVCNWVSPCALIV